MATSVGATVLGVALQLLGLAWDAVQHAADPTLASRESVFTLTNASHVLIGVGLGLVCVSAGGLLLTIAAPRRWIGRVSAGVLAAAMAGVGGVAVTTGAVSFEPHDHGHDHHDTAEAAVSSHPLLATLERVLAENGTEATLERLTAEAEADVEVRRVAHDLAHAIGRASFRHYSTGGEAMVHCTQAFESGCYHGVLQESLSAEPEGDASRAAALCTSGLPEGTTDILRFQCLHGLGHGLMLNSGHDLRWSLTECDRLPDTWTQTSCYGGAFMENLVHGLAMLRGEVAGTPEEIDASLRPDDPHYPCSAVDEKYLAQCYNLQTSAILGMNDWDFAGAFARCAEAPPAFEPVCYESLGRDVAGFTLRDPEESIELCGLGEREAEISCLVGVARNLVGIDWTVDAAVEFCGMAPSSAKDRCYQVVGNHFRSMGLATADVRSGCEAVPESYRSDCERGAGLPVN